MPENTAEQMPQLDNVRDNATQEDFKMKNKVYELLLYAGPQLEEFPRAKRELAKKIDSSMLDVLRLVVALENKHYKKTTLGELDNEVDTLRHLVRLAADPEYTRSKKPYWKYTKNVCAQMILLCQSRKNNRRYKTAA